MPVREKFPEEVEEDRVEDDGRPRQEEDDGDQAQEDVGAPTTSVHACVLARRSENRNKVEKTKSRNIIIGVSPEAVCVNPAGTAGVCMLVSLL